MFHMVFWALFISFLRMITLEAISEIGIDRENGYKDHFNYGLNTVTASNGTQIIHLSQTRFHKKS